MKKAIMKRAWELYKDTGCKSRFEFGLCLQLAWSEVRALKEYKNVVVEHFCSYNFRRYSCPWITVVDDNGRFNFNVSVGTYTGNHYQGTEGDLVVYAPVEGQVYGYGQKDRRGGNTQINFVKFLNGQFIPCDKIGRVA